MNSLQRKFMYYIEMLVEVGNWSVRIAADRKHDIKHNTYSWNPTGGSWARVGGVFTTVEDADATVVCYEQTGSSCKPKAFRVRLL